MSVNVDQVVKGVKSGSIPAQAGLSAILLKSRDNHVEIHPHLPHLLERLHLENDSVLLAVILEIFADLLSKEKSDEVADFLIEDTHTSRLLRLLNNNDFPVRYPLLRLLISLCKLRRHAIQR